MAAVSSCFEMSSLFLKRAQPSVFVKNIFFRFNQKRFMTYLFKMSDRNGDHAKSS